MTCNNLNVDLVNTKVYVKFGELMQFVLKILSGSDILAQINGHYSGTNVREIPCDNSQRRNLAKFCQLVLKILSGNEILT